ncbi:MAG: hypothetical protein HY243_06565 [Proteobacteria bacterium]|nr:hypothetical protein [Pseudomonadota bacterium]
MIKFRAPFFAVVLAGFAVGSPDQAQSELSGRQTLKLTGEYFVYGGTLDDRRLPTIGEAKASISITGSVAVDMFRRMGKSASTASCEEGDETRARKNLVCIREKATGATACYLGLDLKTGRLISGTIC